MINNRYLLSILSTITASSMVIGCSGIPPINNIDNQVLQGQLQTIKVALSTKSLPYVEGSTNINEDEYVKKLRELSETNVRIELIPHREFTQKLTLLLASGELPDILQINGINSVEIVPAVNNGAFYELNDLIEKHAPNLKNKIAQQTWGSPLVSSNGKIYAIPSENYLKGSQVVYVRKDWLEKLHLNTPKTINDYVATLKAFKEKDPNGNGLQDEVPFSGRQNLAFAELFFGAYGVLPGGWKYENNQLVPNFIRPEIKKALEIYHMLYQEQLLDNDVFVQQVKDWDTKIKGASTVGMWLHDPGYPDKWRSEVKQGDPTAEIVTIPAPVGPDAKGGMGIGSSIGPTWAIPKSSKNPIAAIKFMDWFYSETASRFLDYGLEGSDYTIENGKVNYRYPTNADEINRENMHLMFLRFIGPSYLANKELMQGRKDGELIAMAILVSENEGRHNDGLNMPLPPTMRTKPELRKDNLWMDTAAKIIIGKEGVDAFDKFVEDWRKLGGDQVIKEATEWYNFNTKKFNTCLKLNSLLVIDESIK